MPRPALMAMICAYMAQWCAPCRRQHGGRPASSLPSTNGRQRPQPEEQDQENGEAAPHLHIMLAEGRAPTGSHQQENDKNRLTARRLSIGTIPLTRITYHGSRTTFHCPRVSSSCYSVSFRRRIRKGRFRCLKRAVPLRRPTPPPRTRASLAPPAIFALPSLALARWAAPWRASSSNPNRTASS